MEQPFTVRIVRPTIDQPAGKQRTRKAVPPAEKQQPKPTTLDQGEVHRIMCEFLDQVLNEHDE